MGFFWRFMQTCCPLVVSIAALVSFFREKTPGWPTHQHTAADPYWCVSWSSGCNPGHRVSSGQPLPSTQKQKACEAAQRKNVRWIWVFFPWMLLNNQTSLTYSWIQFFFQFRFNPVCSLLSFPGRKLTTFQDKHRWGGWTPSAQILGCRYRTHTAHTVMLTNVTCTCLREYTRPESE